jgi:hypothetical protein
MPTWLLAPERIDSAGVTGGVAKTSWQPVVLE